jgi:hypothetical protein
MGNCNDVVASALPQLLGTGWGKRHGRWNETSTIPLSLPLDSSSSLAYLTSHSFRSASASTMCASTCCVPPSAWDMMRSTQSWGRCCTGQWPRRVVGRAMGVEGG